MKRLTLGALLALVASAILVTPGGAAKPTDAITCDPTTTILSWTSGTTSYSGFLSRADGSHTVEFANDGPVGNGPGSISFATPADAVSATATIIHKKGLSARVNDSDCSS
jgi:hypothetical protein